MFLGLGTSRRPRHWSGEWLRALPLVWVLIPALWAWMEILLFLFSELQQATLFTGNVLFTCRSILGHDVGEV